MPSPLITIFSFKTEGHLLSWAWAIVCFSLLFFCCEEWVDGKIILAFCLASFFSSLLSPYVGVALCPVPIVSTLRFRLHPTETTGCPEEQKSFLKIKSLIVLLIQTFVGLAVFLLRTGKFLLA
uniref:Orf1 protein n=1 Tax=Kudoa hexapunctata TaxID=1450334 RepID=A0A0H5AY21_9CNID|nr:orf1 protein [Kudoa hexapunctata]BAR94703.1 orf1 protein [Kudoa hexapunctata]